MVESYDNEPDGSSSNMFSKWSGKDKFGGTGGNSNKSHNA